MRLTGRLLLFILAAESATLAASCDAPLAAGQWRECLVAVEIDLGGHVPMEQRAVLCAVGALAADKLGEPAAETDWRTRLCGRDSTSRTMFDVVLGAVQRRYDGLFTAELPGELVEKASVLIEKLATDPPRSEWRDVSAALALRGCFGGGYLMPRQRSQLARVQAMSSESAQALLQYLAGAADRLAPRFSTLRMLLRQAVAERLATGPLLADMLLAITPDPLDRLRLAPVLTSGGFRQQAAACGRAVAAMPLRDEAVFQQAASLLTQAGAITEAVALYRRAEVELDPGAGRRARLALLAWLRSADQREQRGAPRPPGLPTSAEEAAARGAGATTALERLALADIALVEGKTDEAATAYARLAGETLPPGLRRVVLAALAEVDAERAWSLLAAPVAGTEPQVDTIATGLVLGLAAGRLGELADWLAGVAGQSGAWPPELRVACVAWLVAHPKELTAPRHLIDTAAGALTALPSRVTETSAMVLAAASQAVRLGHPPDRLRVGAIQYLKRLRELATDPALATLVGTRLQELLPPAP